MHPAPAASARAAGVARAVALAALAVSTAASGHLLAGGHRPSWWVTAVVLVVVAVLLLPTTTRAFSLTRTTPTLLAAQLAVHLGLTLLGTGPAATTARTTSQVPSGHGSHGTGAGAALVDASGFTHTGGHSSSLLPGPEMALAHLVAAALLAVLLARTETSLRSLVAFACWAGVRVAGFLRRLVPPAGSLAGHPAGPGMPRGARPAAAPVRSVWQTATPARRGPPVLA